VVYGERLQRTRGEAQRWGRWDRVLSNLRLVAFLLILGVGWFIFGSRDLAVEWIGPPVVVFVALLVVHDRVIQSRKRADRRAAYYEAGIARLEDRWMGHGTQGDEFREARHPYADDLDLFGTGSLFERLCTARTPVGQRTLADWLKTASDAEVARARARQGAVRELTPRLDLRDDLCLLGEDVRTRFCPDALIAWAKQPPHFTPKNSTHVIAGVLSALSVSALVAWLGFSLGPLPFLAALVPQALFATVRRRQLAPLLASAEAPTRDLALVRDLLARIEAEPVESPLLVALRRDLETGGHTPSERIAELRRLVDLLDARRNQLFAPFAALLLWGTHLGVAIERWRQQIGPAVEGWLVAAGEFEALASISAYAFENPDSTFPEIIEGAPCMHGRALGHPLLADSQCIRNDVALGGEQRALIISGSNMSGKSTYLRTVGCNLLLGLIGAPVRAEALRMTPLTIAASIQISDSLLEGTSHFYAEIKRLRQIVELSQGETPALFLLDEILHGTNSHDRRIGAAAVVKGLVERGALGLVTTHDLALARIADDMAGAIENVHFQDHMEEGKMAFDYRMRAGVVEKSNALELMRAVGLDV
jgi:hypothetical protein